MTRRTLYTTLLALFVGGSAAVPLQAQQTGEEDVPAAQNEPVTVRVTNDSWSDMRIYVVETATRRTPLAHRHRHGIEQGPLRAPRPLEG